MLICDAAAFYAIFGAIVGVGMFALLLTLTRKDKP